MTEQRSYPTTCRSWSCESTGGDQCAGCPSFPKLQEFNEWVRRTRATRPDPTWSPGIWRAAEVQENPAP